MLGSYPLGLMPMGGPGVPMEAVPPEEGILTADSATSQGTLSDGAIVQTHLLVAETNTVNSLLPAVVMSGGPVTLAASRKALFDGENRLVVFNGENRLVLFDSEKRSVSFDGENRFINFSGEDRLVRF